VAKKWQTRGKQVAKHGINKCTKKGLAEPLNIESLQSSKVFVIALLFRAGIKAHHKKIRHFSAVWV